MSKLFYTGLCAAAALSLAACGDTTENNMATENLEDFNATTTEDMNMDMGNMDMNMDMNNTDNMMNNTTGNETGNEAVNNTY